MSDRTGRPNLVYIDCHDLGDFLGCCGRECMASPNIDRLASEGALFPNHSAAAPICVPSRAALYIGRYPHAVGCYGQGPYSEGEVCMAKLFQQDGYETALAGWQVWNPWQRAGYGRAIPCEPTSEETREVIREYAAADKQPFLAHFSFFEVHRPFKDTFDESVKEAIEVPPYLPDTETVRKDLACLHYVVGKLDEHVGRILDAIRENGLEENTIVVLTTDHGPGIARAKHTVYDAGIRAPAVIRYPSLVRPGEHYDALLSNVDLLPTLLEMAGLQVPDNLHGRSFLGLLTGGGYVPRNEVYSEQNWGHWGAGDYYHPSRCLRTNRFKLIRNYTDMPPFIDPDWLGRFGADREMVEDRYGAPSPERELYDIQADPCELKNLARDPKCADTLADLDERLGRHLEATCDAITSGPVAAYETGEPEVHLWEKQGNGSYRFRNYRREEHGEVPFGELLLEHTPNKWPR